jgi:hypothetical protein
VLDALAGLRVPRIYLAVGASHLYPQIATLPTEVVSVDWRYGLNRCRLAMPGKVIQGNLDPAVLLAGEQVIDAAAVQLLHEGMGGAPAPMPASPLPTTLPSATTPSHPVEEKIEVSGERTSEFAENVDLVRLTKNI